jgi:glutathione S-transferase
LILHFHPLSSYCHKALIALYESAVPFTGHYLDLADADVRTRYRALWPIGKMPLLEDQDRRHAVPEATIIIEYLARHYPAARGLVPADPDLAWQVRLRDRFHDLYVMDPMSKIVTDKLRPPGHHDTHGVDYARTTLRTSYDLLERELGSRTWALGDTFTLADCAAAPSLFYAHMVEPFGPEHKRLAAYLGRLKERPSYARVLREAEPFFKLMPV